MDQTHPILEKILFAIPLLKNALAIDSNITLIDKDYVCIGSFPGEKFSLGLSVGDTVSPQTPLSAAVRENKKLVVKIPEHLYNLSLTAGVMPVHDENNRIIGGLGIALETKYEKILKEFHENVERSLSAVNENMNQIHEGANFLVLTSSTLAEEQKQSEVKLKEINDIIKNINQIAKRVQLLGINARIEASRAGESGKGFAIVANEIQKLSTNIFEFTSLIDTSLNDIQKVVGSISESIHNVVKVGDKQVNGIEEINKSLKEAMEMSNSFLIEEKK
ncbi:methyl-accepting chemotaxis protein [Jeotgalibacillus soli]|uniref:Methyl-accepting transducer domain-containing protein n=1 Tax=Jeotgalibacillus soli TaxID=889306 RepID=A0A0C2VMB7_9BACL|nr:methyl-accepting chemotaxis protein [Jeotgalibacillus soli]KIL50027.1 hypothetical protein KP78_14950 [Jeotgalibacillus soli]